MSIRKIANRVLGTPQPYMITPRSEEEALYGKPTLLTPAQIDTLVSAVSASRTYKDPALVEKLKELRGDQS